MKILFLAFMILGSDASLIHAATVAKKNIYLFKDSYIVHEVRPKVWASENCLKDCQALKALDRVNQSPKQENFKMGGRNPGAWRCAHLSGGMVAILADDKGNQDSYCIFKDQSMVDCGAFK